MERGMLIVVSGFSGAGKGTVTRELIKRYDQYALSISATSRKPRPGETEGESYFFKTKDEFEEMIEKDAFIEHACYVGNYYGTPKAYVEKMQNLGKDVILEIEVQGALQIKKKCPDAVTIFMTTKNAKTLKERLVGRGSETMDVIEKRMSRAKEEAELIDQYDFLLVNDDLETCIQELHNLIQSEHIQTTRKKDFIKEIKEELSKN